MAFEDYSRQTGQGQPEDADDNGARRRMMEFVLRSALKPALPPAQANDAGASGSSATSVSAMNQPRVPAPRMLPNEQPTFGTPPIVDRPGGLQPALSRPARPNVAPQRTDFPTKPIPTWEKVLGVAAAPFAPGVTAAIFQGPERKAERQYREATGDWERGLSDQEREAQIRNIDSEIRARDNPKPEKQTPSYHTDDEGHLHAITTGPDGKPVDQIVPGSFGKPTPTPKPTFEEQNYAEWLTTHPNGTRLQFSKDQSAAKQTPERPEKPQRQLALTPDGKVIELTPGMNVPPGTKSLSGELNLTTKTEQGEEAGKAATAYANDYLSGKQWTGAGDEALMEKFFEMAKPSSGFRMTQAQIEMLQRSRDWMGSITAKAKHAFTPEAPWFSDTQRGQIVKTMNDLAKSRETVKPGGGSQAPPASPNTSGGGNHPAWFHPRQ